MKNRLLLAFFVLLTSFSFGQITITPGPTGAALTSSFMGNGLTATNVVINCNAQSYGTFANGNTTNLGLTNGLLMTTGLATQAPVIGGSSSGNDASFCVGTSVIDPQLTSIEPGATNDVCIIEFDVTAVCNQLQVRFVFGSEEYPEYVNAGVNDAFGFFVSGPNPGGGNYTNFNIARLPNNSIVSIDNVNAGVNSAFYVSNSGTTIEYDAFTTVITYSLNLTPCANYHFKLAIGDAGDCIIDSGVFIDFIACTTPPINVATASTAASCGANDGTATATVTGGAGPFNYSWNTTPVQTTATATGLAPGNYTVTVTSTAFPCLPPSTSTVTVGGSGAAPTVTVTPTTGTICNGGNVSLTAAGGTSYTWSPATGLSSTTGATVTASPTTTTTYTVTGTGACGTGTASATITVNPVPTTTAGSNSPICAGTTLNLTATTATGASYSWTGPNGFTSTLQNPTIPNVTTAATGTYTVTVSANGCTSTSTVAVTVNAAPIANAGNDAALCPGSSATLNGSGTGTISWSPATGLSSTTILNPVATPASTTTYTLTLTNAGCVSTDNVTVTVINSTPLQLTPNTSICTGDCTTLTVSGADYYLWNAAAGITDNTAVTQTVCPTATTTYTVTGYTTGPNLIVNGDFSLGNTGFTSSYTLVNPNTNQGQYNIGTNPQAWNGGLSPCGDHTSGTGNMMMINGATVANQSIWCQTVSISPNTDYLFSTWITPAFAVNMPILQFSINGSLLATPFTSSNNLCTWEEFFTTWNSGVNTTANICIVNQNTNAMGNDFAIDDIYFAPVCTQTQNVTVTVSSNLDATITPAGPFCTNNAPVNLTAVNTGGTWSGTGITNASNGTFSPSVAGAGTHTITYSIPGSCGDTQTTTITVTGNQNAAITPAGPFCANDAAINLTAVDAGGTWSGTGITNATNGTFDPAVAGAGTHTITYTIAGACGDTQTTTITVNATANATITPAGPFCADNANAFLAAVTPGGTWSGTGIVNASTGEFSPVAAGAGNHVITYTIGGPCGDVQTTTIQVIANANATVNPAGPFCVSDAATTLTSVNPGGTWSGNGITSAANGTFDPSVAGNGTHTITYTISGVCGDAQSITINVVSILPTTITPVNPLCINSTPVTLSGASPGGTWSGTGITNTATGIFDPAVAGAGTHTITYTIAGNCGSTSTTNITVNPLPIISFNVDINSGCVPVTSTFTNTTPGASNCNWLIDGVPASTSCAMFTHTFTQVNCFDITLVTTDNNGCSNTATINDMVCTFPIPNADFTFTPTNTTVLNPTVNFTNQSTGGTIYQWDFAGLGTSTQTNPSFTFPDSAASYLVCLNVSNASGCSDDICKVVTIYDELLIYVPNAFTPDGDGKNDVFLPIVSGIDPNSYEFFIFNRWGELIFESQVPDRPWDGTYRSQNSKQDVYVWKIKAKKQGSGEKVVYYGHVSLLR